MTGDVAWRLDVLDPIGGLAFASHRQSDGQAKRLDATPPAVFVGAPTFRPIGVRSRSIGLAAARRGFQPGLFIQGDEVGFPELEDVIEFVRRCYQNGGGGAGGGGAPPPGPEGPGPEFPGLPEMKLDGERSELSIMTSLRSDLKRYEKGHAELKGRLLGESFRADWSHPAKLQYRTDSTSPPISHSADGMDILARGATRILAEMIRRFPFTTENPDAHVNWQGAWLRLIMTIERMGMLDYWYGQYFDYLAQLLISIESNIHSRLSQEFFFHHRDPIDMLGGLERWRGLDLESIDAFDDLSTWPSPTSPAQRPRMSAYQNSPSILNQVAVFLSAPPVHDGSRSLDAEIELVLFAAARLVLPSSRENRTLALAAGYRRFWLREELARRRAVERLADAAWEWLADQLPRRGFAPSLERAIASTSTLVVA